MALHKAAEAERRRTAKQVVAAYGRLNGATAEHARAERQLAELLKPRSQDCTCCGQPLPEREPGLCRQSAMRRTHRHHRLRNRATRLTVPGLTGRDHDAGSSPGGMKASAPSASPTCPWAFVLSVHPPPSTRHCGYDLLGPLQVGEVLVVRHRTQGTTLGIDDQSRPGRLVPALYAHHAADLGVGAIEDRGPAGLIEVAKRHRPIISNNDARASQVSLLCTFIRTRLCT